MKKAVLSFLILFISLIVFCQDVQYEDVVYLKNGSVIRGMIIEQIPNETIKIKTADNNLFVFEFEQIKKITKEETSTGINENGNKERTGNGELKYRGFESLMDVYLALEMEEGNPLMGMNITAGYRFFPQLFIGAGAGLELYPDGNMVPVFFNARTDFVPAKATPFFSINVGYAFGWVEDTDGSDWGGVFYEPGIGVRFNISKNFGFNLSSTLKFQRAYTNYYEYCYPDPGYHEYRESITYRLFTFKVGFSF